MKIGAVNVIAKIREIRSGLSSNEGNQCTKLCLMLNVEFASKIIAGSSYYRGL